MYVIEAALIANLDSRQRRAAGRSIGSGRPVTLASVLRRAFAFVATVGIVVIALQIASAGASIHQVASIAVAG